MQTKIQSDTTKMKLFHIVMVALLLSVSAWGRQKPNVILVLTDDQG